MCQYSTQCLAQLQYALPYEQIIQYSTLLPLLLYVFLFPSYWYIIAGFHWVRSTNTVCFFSKLVERNTAFLSLATTLWLLVHPHQMLLYNSYVQYVVIFYPWSSGTNISCSMSPENTSQAVMAKAFHCNCVKKSKVLQFFVTL